MFTVAPFKHGRMIPEWGWIPILAPLALWVGLAGCYTSKPGADTSSSVMVPQWVEVTLTHAKVAQDIYPEHPGWEALLRGDYLSALAVFRERNETESQARVMLGLSVVYRNLANIHAQALTQYFSARARLRLGVHRDLRRVVRHAELWTHSAVSSAPGLRLHPARWSPCPRAKDLASRVGCGDLDNLEASIRVLESESTEPSAVISVRDPETRSSTTLKFFDPLRVLALADGYLRLGLHLMGDSMPGQIYEEACNTRPDVCFEAKSRLAIKTSPIGELRIWSLWIDPISMGVTQLSKRALQTKREMIVDWAKAAPAAVRRRASQNSVSNDISDGLALEVLAETYTRRRWGQTLLEAGECRQALAAFRQTLKLDNGPQMGGINTPVVWSRMAWSAFCARRYTSSLASLRVLESNYPAATGIAEAVKLLAVVQLIEAPEGQQERGS